MKTRKIIFYLFLTLCLTACTGKTAQTSLSPQEQAYAQTQFVQQAATSAAAYAGTAQPNPLSTAGMPTATPAIAGSQTPGLLLASATPLQPSGTANPALTLANPPRTNTQAPNPSATSAVNPSATLTRTTAPGATSTPTATATQLSGWQGDWVISFQKDDGTYLSGGMSVSLNGDQLLAEAVFNGSPYQFNGKLINNGQVAFGTWSSTQTSGLFTWTLVSIGQFGGDRDLLYGVCGARAGEAMPDPCYIPPLS